MPRKGEVRRREILPDPKFHDRMVAKFINAMMNRGKRSTAERILYTAFDRISDRAKEEPLGLFKRALDNVKPVVEVRSRRVGGATYQVPSEVRPTRRVSLAMRWLVVNARTRAEKSMAERLAAELMDAANNRGGAIKKKEDTHRMAEANKAFAHYRW
ncbi:MAG TPA: 30S ribosomal protein S7 [Candidatus Margulisiibacteriota bacterium]|nr:30S ribosomal protein S7 [Candidatus Margulisiibacteriota bacterium]